MLGLAATAFSLRVLHLRRKKRIRERVPVAQREHNADAATGSAKTAVVSDSKDTPGQTGTEMEAEPSWLGEAAALVGLTFESNDGPGSGAGGDTGVCPVDRADAGQSR